MSYDRCSVAMPKLPKILHYEKKKKAQQLTGENAVAVEVVDKGGADWCPCYVGHLRAHAPIHTRGRQQREVRHHWV